MIVMVVKLEKPVMIIHDGSVKTFEGAVDTPDKELADKLIANGGVTVRAKPKPEQQAE